MRTNHHGNWGNCMITKTNQRPSHESSETHDDPTPLRNLDKMCDPDQGTQHSIYRGKRETQEFRLTDALGDGKLDNLIDAKRTTGQHPKVRSTSTDSDIIRPVPIQGEVHDEAPGESTHPYYGHDDEVDTADIFEEV